MADEIKKDEIIDEDAQLKAQLDAIKRGEQPEPPAEAAAAEPVEVEVEVKPEEKLPVETKPAEEKPPVETKPDETRPPAGKAWQSLRAKEKALADKEAHLAEVQAQLDEQNRKGKPNPDEPPSLNEYPADNLDYRLNKTNAEIARIQQELAQRQQQDNYRAYIDGIRQQEEVFEKDHPDYRKATAFLIDKDIKQWERAGLSVIHTNQILQYAHSNDPQYAPYRRNVERLANDAGVIAFAEKEGRDVEEVAAYVTARDTWLTQRRDLLAQGAQARGVSVAQSAYEEAVDRGWNSNGNGQVTQRETEARARVAQAKEVSAASRSLSDSATGEAAPEVRVIKNRNQVLDLDEATLDRLIESGGYKQL